jgi:hypothetical protein
MRCVVNTEDFAMLTAAGWLVECESPLEICHEATGSRATGVCAEVMIESLRRDGAGSVSSVQRDPEEMPNA